MVLLALLPLALLASLLFVGSSLAFPPPSPHMDQLSLTTSTLDSSRYLPLAELSLTINLHLNPLEAVLSSFYFLFSFSNYFQEYQASTTQMISVIIVRRNLLDGAMEADTWKEPQLSYQCGAAALGARVSTHMKPPPCFFLNVLPVFSSCVFHVSISGL